ncbi:MAG: DUF420 domain-containing protein [Planctomycetes bacterium]|nr:DUF420 domain-containing protein [Planctomycetota bacterium]
MTPAIAVDQLPTLNAVLNATSAAFLIAGYAAIRRRRTILHRRLMLSAFGVSTAFLISYVTYHALAGSRPYEGPAWSRPVYYTMLITHVVLAAAVVPLVLVTLVRALRGRFDAHRRLARWTLPIWLYVSVTGVAIYGALYVL